MLVFTEDIARYFVSLGLQNELIGVQIFQTYFWEIRKCTSRSIVYVNRCYSLKICVVSTYLKNIEKIFPFHKVTENFHESLRVYMNRVDHDFR